MTNDKLNTLLYLEALQSPKLAKGLERLIGKYGISMNEYHTQTQEELQDIVERAYLEHNSILILPEYLGHLVLVWK